MRESPLLQYAHPDAVVRDPLLSEEENALGPLRASVQALTASKRVDDLVSCFDGDCDCREAACLSCHPIEDEELYAQISELMDQNRETLRLLDTALARGRLQIQIVPPNFEGDGISLGESRSLCRLLKLQSLLLGRQGDWDAAATKLLDIFYLGRMVASSGMQIQRMVGTNIQGVAIWGFEYVADQGLRPETMAQVIVGLDLLMESDVFANSLRREFCWWCIPQIEQLDSAEGMDKQIDLLIEWYFPNRPMVAWLDNTWTDDGRLARRREHIGFLLAGHPHPWDAKDTVARLSSFVADQISAILATKIDLSTGVFEVAPQPAYPDETSKWWPKALAPGIIYELLGDSPDADAAWAEAAASISESIDMQAEMPRRSRWPTQPALDQARQELQSITNPIGRLFSVYSIPTCTLSLLQGQVEMAAKVRRKLSAKLTPSILSRIAQACRRIL